MCLCFYGLYVIAAWKLSIKSLLLKGINALPSSTSFLRWICTVKSPGHMIVSMLFRAPLHFYDPKKGKSVSCTPVSMLFRAPLHFYLHQEITRAESELVSMLFRAPLHFYSVTPSGSNSRQMCQCSSELHFISTVLQRTFCKRIRIVSMLFRAPLHFYPDLSETLDLQGFLRPFLQVFFRIF